MVMPSFRKVASTQRLNRFAELLSQDLDIPTIRIRMGLTTGQATGLMGRICRDLGWQAR